MEFDLGIGIAAFAVIILFVIWLAVEDGRSYKD